MFTAPANPAIKWPRQKLGRLPSPFNVCFLIPPGAANGWYQPVTEGCSQPKVDVEHQNHKAAAEQKQMYHYHITRGR